MSSEELGTSVPMLGVGAEPAKDSPRRKAKDGCLLFWATWINEMTCGASNRHHPDVRAEVDVVLKEIQEHPIMVYTKVGCPFCERGLAYLSKFENAAGLKTRVGSGATTRLALQVVAGLPEVTFPFIVINGVYYGGTDDVIGDPDLKCALNAANTNTRQPHLSSPIQWSPPFTESRKLNLVEPPTGLRGVFLGRSKMCTHTKVWANSIRLLSLVHVILFALCILLRALDQMVLVHVIGWVIFVDLVLFVLHGAHPIAPLSTLCTALIWKRKGSAVVILPYKAVFVAYLLALGRLAFNSQGAENASEFNSVLIGAIINSSMLAVTRF